MLWFQPLDDTADEAFIPEVDISEKPWFHDEGTMSVGVEVSKNMHIALREVPLAKQRAMGHKVEDMIQECVWNGKPCSPL